MGSISKWASLYTSLTSGSNESTAALACFNIDFSLTKFDPPSEFKELGSSLSALRREEADSGSIHQTARRFVKLQRGYSIVHTRRII